jgi:hypothetical protein
MTLADDFKMYCRVIACDFDGTGAIDGYPALSFMRPLLRLGQRELSRFW